MSKLIPTLLKLIILTLISQNMGVMAQDKRISYVQDLYMHYGNGIWTCGLYNQCPSNTAGCQIIRKNSFKNFLTLKTTYYCLDDNQISISKKKFYTQLPKAKAIDIDIVCYLGAEYSVQNIFAEKLESYKGELDWKDWMEFKKVAIENMKNYHVHIKRKQQMG